MLLSRLQRASRSALRTYATIAEAAGVKVAGFEGGSPPATTSITVVVKGGARYESKPGVAHVLKNFAFKSTAAGSALKTARETELYGGVLSSALGREHLFLTAQFLRGDEAHFLELLASVLSSTHYYPHEYAELVLPSIESETLASLASPSTLALDLAHSVAFRRGLGNSLFASPHSPVSAADVKAYAQQAYAKSNIAVLGGGISTDKLASAVQRAFPGSAASRSSFAGSPAKYYGGEQRVPLDVHATPGAQPTLIIAFGATGQATPALKIMPHLLGGQSSFKWIPGTSPLALIADKVPGSSIKATLYPYSDASLFAVEISAPTSAAVGDLAKQTVQAIKAVGNVEADEVKKAIAKAKFAEATKFESARGLLEIAGPALFAGSIPEPDESFGSLDGVDATSFTKAATDLFSATPTVVAVGNLGVLPYADELGF